MKPQRWARPPFLNHSIMMDRSEMGEDNVRDNGQSHSTSTGNNLNSNSHTVYVTIPSSNSKGSHSVIQQPHQSVIQSTSLQTVQLSKSGSVILLKHPSNSVIQSPGNNNNLQTLQVINTDSFEEIEPSRKRQILARRPSYKKILNDLSGEKVDQGQGSDSSQDDPPSSISGTTITLGGQQYQTTGLLKVIPASSIQLSGGQSGDGNLQTIAMSNTNSCGNAIVHYAPGNSEGQLIVPAELGALKIASSSMTQNLVLTPSSNIHGDNIVEEANRKREMRLMKNREAARECRAKKKEYIKCLENRVAVLENQNRTLIEELRTLKTLYGLNDVKE